MRARHTTAKYAAFSRVFGGGLGMNVLLIGSGGREHALAWALSASPLLARLYCAPGDAGIAEAATCVALDAADHAAVARFCRENVIGLVVVGPETPLVAGLTDDLTAAGIKVFGPSRAAARLEGSKGFAKDFWPNSAYRRRVTRASRRRPPRSPIWSAGPCPSS